MTPVFPFSAPSSSRTASTLVICLTPFVIIVVNERNFVFTLNDLLDALSKVKIANEKLSVLILRDLYKSFSDDGHSFIQEKKTTIYFYNIFILIV